MIEIALTLRYEKLNDIKGVIRSRASSKKDRQYNEQKKKDKHQITLFVLSFYTFCNLYQNIIS